MADAAFAHVRAAAVQLLRGYAALTSLDFVCTAVEATLKAHAAAPASPRKRRAPRLPEPRPEPARAKRRRRGRRHSAGAPAPLPAAAPWARRPLFARQADGPPPPGVS